MTLEELLEQMSTGYKEAMPAGIDSAAMFSAMANAVRLAVPEAFIEMTLRHQKEAEDAFGNENVQKFMDDININSRLAAGQFISDALTAGMEAKK
jgi:hypothetical protein